MVFTVSITSHKTHKLFYQRHAMPQPQKSKTPEIFIRKSEKISPLLSTPRSLWKNKESSCKVWGRGRLLSRHTQAGKKKLFLWKNMMRSLENRKRSSLPASPHPPHLLTERVGFETAWLRRSNHFPPISLLFSLRVFPLFVVHTAQTLLSMRLFCIAMNTNHKD